MMKKEKQKVDVQKATGLVWKKGADNSYLWNGMIWHKQ
jgi:hypothetical protein